MHLITTSIVLGLVNEGINTKKDLAAHSGKSLEQISSAVNTLVNKKKIIQCNDNNGSSMYESAGHRFEKWFEELPDTVEEASRIKHRTDFDSYAKMITGYNRGGNRK